MFWNNTDYKWVRKRKGGHWLKVQSYLDASCGIPYWIHNRSNFPHETFLGEREIY